MVGNYYYYDDENLMFAGKCLSKTTKTLNVFQMLYISINSITSIAYSYSITSDTSITSITR